MFSEVVELHHRPTGRVFAVAIQNNPDVGLPREERFQALQESILLGFKSLLP